MTDANFTHVLFCLSLIAADARSRQRIYGCNIRYRSRALMRYRTALNTAQGYDRRGLLIFLITRIADPVLAQCGPSTISTPASPPAPHSAHQLCTELYFFYVVAPQQHSGCLSSAGSKCFRNFHAAASSVEHKCILAAIVQPGMVHGIHRWPHC